MTVQAETSVTADKQHRVRQGKTWGLNKQVAVEQREGQAPTKREITGFRLRRDRIFPDMSATDDDRRSRRRKNLTVKTESAAARTGPDTPNTAASTPTPQSGTRGSTDLRSPGQRASPRVAANDAPLPDFMTQTDKYGNATTPRSATAIQTAQTDPTVADSSLTCDGAKQHELVDVCTETLLDSVRLMCCCLIPEDGVSKSIKTEQSEKSSSAFSRQGLLPALHPDDAGKKCLVLDLDETLVHSSFRAVPGADFVIPVQIEDVVHFVYVAKRPGVDEFLTEMAKHYELVIYTASLNKYADPLLDLLDPNRVIRTRLFRESCVYHEGNYVKDLSKLDRDLRDTIIIDNSPNSYSFQPDNAIDCSSFIDDPRDRELPHIAAFLTGIKDVRDVRGICREWRDWPNVNLENQ